MIILQETEAGIEPEAKRLRLYGSVRAPSGSDRSGQSHLGVLAHQRRGYTVERTYIAQEVGGTCKGMCEGAKLTAHQVPESTRSECEHYNLRPLGRPLLVRPFS